MKDIKDVPEIKGLDSSEEGVKKSFNELTDELDRLTHIPDDDEEGPHFVNLFDERELEKLIADIQKKMKKAAAELNFEAAAEYRDRLIMLKNTLRDID